MWRLAALLGFALVPATVLAQDAKPLREAGPVEESANRIAREWWPNEPTTTTFTIDEQGRARFRTGTIEKVPAPPWQPSPDDPLLTPARGAISHQEMVRMMTPQQFSTPMISVGVDPGAIRDSIKKVWREWQARRIHERVVKELEEFERQRAESNGDSSN